MNDFEMMVREFAEDAGEKFGVNPEDILIDFVLYNEAIDRMMDRGLTEDKAIAYVSSNWDFSFVDR